MRVAILDSDHAHADRLCHTLMIAGYECSPFYSEKSFADQNQAGHFDLLILGQYKPLPNRAVWIKKIRHEHSDLPMLLLVDDSDVNLILDALASGVNDYLCLPIRQHELRTRVHVLLGHDASKLTQEKIEYGPFVFQRYPNRVMHHGIPIRLTEKEFELALLLFRHLGQPVSRAYISEAVWRTTDDDFTRTIDTHISRVRNKLGLREENGFHLSQVYGYGYELVSV